MRIAWAAVLGLALGAALAWWFGRDTPEHARLREQRAQRAAAEAARDARPSLYEWRDANGVRNVADHPPKHGRYRRIDATPRPGIEIDGDRH